MTKKPVAHPHPTPHELGVYWIPADDSIPMAYKLVEPNYPAMMNLVGGWLEKFPFTVGLPNLDCGCKVVMMANEEAKLEKGTANLRANFFTTTPVVGDVFLVAEGPVKSEEEDEEDCINHVGLPPLYHHWSGPGTPLPAS